MNGRSIQLYIKTKSTAKYWRAFLQFIKVNTWKLFLQKKKKKKKPDFVRMLFILKYFISVFNEKYFISWFNRFNLLSIIMDLILRLCLTFIEKSSFLYYLVYFYYYSTFFCYYSEVSLHVLVLFMSLIILF